MRRIRRKYYDLFSHFYDGFVAFHSHDQSGRPRRRLAVEAGLQPGEIVLDLCTGTGAMLLELHAALKGEGLVVGVDFSIGMLKKAKSKLDSAGEVLLIQADVANLPFKKSVFDAVTCSHAFYELTGTTSDRCLKEIVRVLRPGQAFLMMEHEIPQNPLIRLFFYVRIFTMGKRRALEVLRNEEELFLKYFDSAKTLAPETGRSKIIIGRTAGAADVA